ncbi:Dr family adhesin structural subunit [Salmonella enterica subsp. enterica serovar Carmel]|nr:Dr family adhesin structural subunit [Salmonella enterica subsp. enterica serovar Carmel]ELJ4789501.1 Dr family adhesin structural subunit [Salmonella enterica]
MKKTLISTFIAAACLTASGAAMAGDKDAVQTGTVTTTVTGVSGVTITLTDSPQTVTTEDVKSPGVTLTTLGIEATGLDLSSAAGGNIAVEVDNDHIDGSGAWLFKDPTQPNSNLKARPKSESGWNHNPENRIAYRLQNSSQNVNIQLPIETNSGNTNVTAGHYELPVTVSFNTW